MTTQTEAAMLETANAELAKRNAELSDLLRKITEERDSGIVALRAIVDLSRAPAADSGQLAALMLQVEDAAQAAITKAGAA